jgi:hypothetical protein
MSNVRSFILVMSGFHLFWLRTGVRLAPLFMLLLCFLFLVSWSFVLSFLLWNSLRLVEEVSTFIFFSWTWKWRFLSSYEGYTLCARPQHPSSSFLRGGRSQYCFWLMPPMLRQALFCGVGDLNIVSDWCLPCSVYTGNASKQSPGVFRVEEAEADSIVKYSNAE